eukprot:TRINITY_DN67928_c5_g10_i1.p2 TRINITY_DN67928_c5_g10~~TRINITY_DN67928_c5_g10_i1.p2  ORF type:complete len:426 (+),score=255.71 TRINITY_DN67928_c5_g10_i1:168-1445(+)
MSTKLEKLLGEEVLTASGRVKVAELAKTATAVGLYFSAHWCAPCRNFTPMLAKLYGHLKDKKGFEIVFVSSDRDEDSFKDYYGSMPWLALPFEDRARKTKLSTKFGVQGIPSLVIVDAKTGKTITKDGRSSILQDPEGLNFPWRPPTVKDALGTEFVDSKGNKYDADHLKGKVVGLYFSAHWCPPCKQFTPILVDRYNKLKKAGKNFEVVFVSSDQDEAQFQSYLGEMPWIAVPFSDKERKGQLSTLFEVEGIPTFVVLDENLKVITPHGRSAVTGDSDGSAFPWKPAPIHELAPHTAGSLNSEPALLVDLTGEPESDRAALIEELTTVAKSFKDGSAFEKKVDDDDDDSDDELNVNFFYLVGGPLDGRLRSLTGAPSDVKIVMLDIPAQGSYWAPASTKLSGQAVADFVKQYHAEKLDKHDLVG